MPGALNKPYIKYGISASLAFSLSMSACLAETTKTENLFKLSLDQLLNVKVAVPAAVTHLSDLEAPAAITKITEGDIKKSAARNIYDLIETHVPGAFWFNHEDGPHPAVRGSITNRNYKYLLLVNDKVMNNTAHFGAKSELEMWDLDDVFKIEIIRGPGSVTYGPGAVAGVIKITTHTWATAKDTRASVNYIDKYDSTGGALSHSQQLGEAQLYSHISYQRTRGFTPNHFLVSRDFEAGFIGKDYDLDSEAMEYFADFGDTPQIKLHLDGQLSDNWRAWFRYTQQGSTWRGNEVKSDFDGELLNQQGTQDRQWTLNLDYSRALSNTWSLKVSTSLDSYDTERRGENVRNPDPEHASNKRINFSEQQWFTRAMSNWKPNDHFEVATGLEYSREKFGPGWGDSKFDMSLGDGGNIINSIDSRVFRARLRNPLFVDDGWYASTYSVLAEANIQVSEKGRVLLSGRGDKNTYSNTLFSPRAAYIHSFNNQNILKFLAQRSRRLNTAAQNYAEFLTGNDPTDESLTSYEIMFNSFYNEKGSYQISLFHNNGEVISYEGNENRSIPVGELQLLGLEVETEYSWSKVTINTSYSHVKQQDWQLVTELAGSNVSYSDYNEEIDDGIFITDQGNDLNNWFNQALKLNISWNYSPTLSVHASALYFWDYQGGKDGLIALEDATEGTTYESDVDNVMSQIRDVNAHEANAKVDLSLRYSPSPNTEISLYAHNLLSLNGKYKRYSFDSGNDDPQPRKLRFIEEPAAVGIKFFYTFK